MNKPLPKPQKQKAATTTGNVNVQTDKVYNAYKPVLVSDGIQTWVQHTYDNTVPWTKDDTAKFIEGHDRLGPHERIEDMQAMLATLPTDNPAITLHADAIRAIHREVQAPPVGFNRERLAELDRASEHWGKILIIRDVMPVARKGQASLDQSRQASLQPRAKKPFTQAVRNAMGEGKKDNQDFKTFMQMWRLGHINGLTIKAIESGDRYIITDEDGDLGNKAYGWGTLEKMYSQKD